MVGLEHLHHYAGSINLPLIAILFRDISYIIGKYLKFLLSYFSQIQSRTLEHDEPSILFVLFPKIASVLLKLAAALVLLLLEFIKDIVLSYFLFCEISNQGGFIS